MLRRLSHWPLCSRSLSLSLSLSLSPNYSDRVGTVLGHRLAEVAERLAHTAAVAHSARPRPMVTPISCFQCFPKSIALEPCMEYFKEKKVGQNNVFFVGLFGLPTAAWPYLQYMYLPRSLGPNR